MVVNVYFFPVFTELLDESSKMVVVDISPIKYDTRKAFSAIVKAMRALDIHVDKSRKEIENEFAILLPVILFYQEIRIIIIYI